MSKEYKLTEKLRSKYENEIGKSYNNLTVKNILGHDKYGVLYVNCKCSKCDKYSSVVLRNIRNNNSKPCKNCNPRNRKHGMSKTRIYMIYTDMKKRCLNQNHSDYPRYGARGIKICERWLESFENFYTDMIIGYADTLTLDRINNNGNYELENCRWISKTEQNKNKGNYYIEFECKKYKIADYIELLHLDIKQETFRSRLKLGWSVEKATRTPVNKMSR